MKKFNEKKVEWINEGARLKKLRESHQISRAELARLMNTSSTRLARLENGEGVKDARILSRFYEYILKHQDLVEELETLHTDFNGMKSIYELLEKYVVKDFREKGFNISKRTAKEFYLDISRISQQQNSKKTRSNSRKIIYI